MTIHQSPETVVEPEVAPPPHGAPAFKSRHAETIALHGGSFRFDPTSGAVAVPIYQTSSYQLPGTEGADKLFALEAEPCPSRKRGKPSRRSWPARPRPGRSAAS